MIEVLHAHIANWTMWNTWLTIDAAGITIRRWIREISNENSSWRWNRWEIVSISETTDINSVRSDQKRQVSIQISLNILFFLGLKRFIGIGSRHNARIVQTGKEIICGCIEESQTEENGKIDVSTLNENRKTAIMWTDCELDVPTINLLPADMKAS